MQNIDLALGGLIMTYHRIKVVDFLYPYTVDSLSYGTSKSDITVNFDVLIKPFDVNVWICLLITFALFFILDYVENNFELMDKILKNRRYKNNLVWTSMCILIGQRCLLLDKFHKSLKICILIWLLSTIMLDILYSSNLFSILTIPDEFEFDSVKKLAHACDKGEIITLIQNNTNMSEAFPVILSNPIISID